jgi:hypothetical protein
MRYLVFYHLQMHIVLRVYPSILPPCNTDAREITWELLLVISESLSHFPCFWVYKTVPMKTYYLREFNYFV